MSHGEADPARTTSAASSAPAVGAMDGPGAVLGRYQIERELGAGAIGLVYAAFDPDLQRRIALKVLRPASASLEARERLLREARAMARLAHPTVVTVYEAGTAAGRDFIAMELIHGETLADWLRALRRSPAAILDAFLTAGRGLVAAHSVGIVHRDFKPRNVLRSSDGRVAVTDFGLARDTDGKPPLALEDTLPIGAPSRPWSERPELTETGALLGTPAYMAPEQWRGDAITPATDQFAYCVALWEALAGERPYRGATLDELRRHIERGPAALDASRIPRGVRGLLLRGLEPDPARRWPNMDALLARLSRARKTPGLAVAIAGCALAAAAALIVSLHPGGESPLTCGPPVRDPMTVWSPAIASDLRAKTSDAHVAVLAAVYRDWQLARAQACTAPAQVRQAQLSCLDGVLARFDVLRQAFSRVPDSLAEELQANLVDSIVCLKQAIADIPRLTLVPTPQVIAAYSLYSHNETEHRPNDSDLLALAGASNPDHCARVIATLAYDANAKDLPLARSLIAGVAGAADQCGDERLRADLRIRESRYHWELPAVGPRGEAAIEQAQIAAAHVMQPELEIAIAEQRLIVARQRAQWVDAFHMANTALAEALTRAAPIQQLRAVIARNTVRIARAEPADLVAIADDVRTWRPIAIARHRADLVHRLDLQDVTARFWRGEVASAHADAVRLWQAELGVAQAPPSRRITGVVVDDRDRPVAGALIATASNLFADTVGIGLPAFVVGDFLQNDLRTATSDAAGHFVIEGAASTGAIVAELVNRRSNPVPIADHVRLVLEPTRTISGKLDLASIPYPRVRIVAEPVPPSTGGFAVVAPVAPDGVFTIGHAGVGALRISAIVGKQFDMSLDSQMIPASFAPVTNLTLSLTSPTRTLDVIVRSAVAAELGGAEVYLLPGKHHVARSEDLRRLQITGDGFARPVTGYDVPASVRDLIRRGDLVAHVEYARPGNLTACVVNFSGDWLDPAFRQRWQGHLAHLPFKCEPIRPTDTVVVIEVPPQPRFDR